MPRGLQHRRAARTGRMTGPTTGIDGLLQANVVILPKSYADAFLVFCKANHRACPLLAHTNARPGSTAAPGLAEGSNIRTDLPSYDVHTLNADGSYSTRQTHDISSLWQDDFVTFYLGCSFTFEVELEQHGIPVLHRNTKRNVAMYRTNRRCIPVHPFSGQLIVSMRGIPKSRLEETSLLCRGHTLAHGSPITAGDPCDLGIQSLEQPDFGEFTPANYVSARDDDTSSASDDAVVPVFWCCGVTASQAALSADAPIVITHSPGHMFVTDIPANDANGLIVSPSLLPYTSDQYCAISAVEDLLASDPGQRGLTRFRTCGELWRATTALADAERIAIISGFPCLLDRDPPTETDGPAGAIALAQALSVLGKQVVLVCDPVNRAIVEAGLGTLHLLCPESSGSVSLFVYPRSGCSAHDIHADLKCSAVVSIERPGRASDGRYYTARANDMSHLLAPIDDYFQLCFEHPSVVTIGVGDGGNELGMGHVLPAVQQGVHLGSTIGTTTCADVTLTCGVSNWGGSALGACTAWLLQSPAPVLALNRDFNEAVLKATVQAGARDGILKGQPHILDSTDPQLLSVDGMPFATHQALFERIAALLPVAQ